MKRTFLLSLFGLLMAASLLTSCGERLFDYEGDCEVTHSIRFVYDMNLKWADAFPSEVKSVNLYAFDSKGVFVKEYSDSGAALSEPGYSMLLDLPVGRYKFVAWCGLENDGVAGESFTVPQPVAGVTTIDELTCTLNTERSGDAEYSKNQLRFLYHGYLEAELVDNHDGTKYEYEIRLTKDTNHIRIILQELTGDGMDKNDYEFTIEDANGVMEYDNRLAQSGVITYMPWNQDADELGVGKTEAEGGLKYIKGVYADLTVSRIMASHSDDMMLTVMNSQTHEPIARVPLIQYALLSKKYYEQTYGHAMEDQEFLDREDEYVLTFFLEKNRWLNSEIMIHSWRVVRHDYGVGE